MASWSELLRQARLGTGFGRRALASLSGVSEETIFSYEHGRRSPSREKLLDLTRSMKLDGAATNAILEGAGLEPLPSVWLQRGLIQQRPFSDLQPEIDSYAWPCLALNERFEIVAWNKPAIAVAELDFATAMPQPHQRNLLRMAAMEHFRARLRNWDEVVSVMVGMFKNYHMGNEDLELGSPYFQTVVQDILEHDSGILDRLTVLWATTPPRPQATRNTWDVKWQTADGAQLAFHCVQTAWDEFNGIGIDDWHPADCQTWDWLSSHV